MQLNLWRAITTEPGMSLQQSSVPAWCEVCRWRKPSDGRQLYKKCVEKTEELGAPEQDGLCLEACLSYLTKLS